MPLANASEPIYAAAAPIPQWTGSSASGGDYDRGAELIEYPVWAQPQRPGGDELWLERHRTPYAWQVNDRKHKQDGTQFKHVFATEKGFYGPPLPVIPPNIIRKEDMYMHNPNGYDIERAYAERSARARQSMQPPAEDWHWSPLTR